MNDRRHRFPSRPLLAALLALSAALPACAPLIVGGAMAGGAMMAMDRRTSGIQVEDETIELKASNRVSELATLGHVNVTSYNRLVLVTGEVPTADDKAKIEAAIGRIENVQKIVNEQAVMANSSFSARSNDSLLSGKVKASYVDAKDIQANAIKVVTERGIVYLMGRVTEREANRASEIARGVAGVQKVVRVFEILTEAELNNLAKPPPK